MEDEAPIVGFRDRCRYTAPDRRNSFALNANDLSFVKCIDNLLTNEIEFQGILLYFILCIKVLISFESQESLQQNEDMRLSQFVKDLKGVFREYDEMMDNFDNFDDNNIFGTNDVDMMECIENDYQSVMKGFDEDYNMVTLEEDYRSEMNKSNSTMMEDCWNDVDCLFNHATGTENTEKKSMYERTLMFLVLLLGWSMVDMDDLCDILIETTSIKRSQWNEGRLLTRSPKKNRKIADFSDAECYLYTRFTKEELQILMVKFFGDLGDGDFVVNGNRFTFEETLLIALTYMSTGMKYSSMVLIFGGDYTRYTYPINFFARYVTCKYFHRISGQSIRYWAPSVVEFRRAIWKKVCFDEEGTQDIHVPLENFRIFGMIDAMQNPTCSPGSGPIDDEGNRNPDRFYIQRAFFTSYGKKWGMKTQAVHLPNGMLGHVWFSSIAHNDKGTLNLSALEPELMNAFDNFRTDSNELPAFFGDEIYTPSQVLVKRNGQNGIFYERLTSTRTDIEHGFGLNSSLWKRLSMKNTWKILQMGEHIQAHLLSIFFMTNVYTCLRGNKTCTKFEFDAPSLDEYLDVNVNDYYVEQDPFIASILMP